MGWVLKVVAGIGIAIAFLVVVAGAAVYVGYQESKPYVEREYVTPVYDHQKSCASPCSSLSVEETFAVPAGANRVDAHLSVSVAATSGTARITVIDPQGKIVYDKTISPGSATSLEDDASWAPVEGEWKVRTEYVAWSGTLGFDVFARGLPPGSLG